MAFEGQQPVKVIGAVSGADLSASTAQYKFVKFNGTGLQVILCSATTDLPCGVLQGNTPTSAVGQPVEVTCLGQTKVQAGTGNGFTAAGQAVGTDVNGQAAKYVAGTDTTKYGVGQTVDTPSGPAQGVLIDVLINCINPARLA